MLMVTGEDLRQLAMSLPHVIEKPHFERTSFRVSAPRGKIFATMLEAQGSANMMLSPEEQQMLCAAEPDMFSPVPNKWGEKGSTTIDLHQTDKVTLKSALHMAWRRAAPEKLWPLLES